MAREDKGSPDHDAAKLNAFCHFRRSILHPSNHFPINGFGADRRIILCNALRVTRFCYARSLTSAGIRRPRPRLTLKSIRFTVLGGKRFVQKRDRSEKSSELQNLLGCHRCFRWRIFCRITTRTRGKDTSVSGSRFISDCANCRIERVPQTRQ